MKKAKPNPKANRNILLIVYLIVGLFIGMSVYLGYFIQVESEDVINNPYNSARLNKFEEQVVRGRILASDGTILAETIVSEDGTETRSYPQGSLFAHVAGYSSMGKTGIESLANYYLLSSHINPLTKAVNQLTDKKSDGDVVVTTLHTQMQEIAYEALGDRKGAVVAMEPGTGKILAMVSKPAFDPNRIDEQWEEFINGDQTEALLLNRATQGLYPPGSTFKIITALQYMREHPGAYNEYRFGCDGIYEFQNFTIQCYHKTAHGEEDFEMAFANSCNGAFSSLGQEMDLTSLKNLSEQVLFNREQPLSIPYSMSTYVMEDGAKDWEIAQTVIGQGNTLMTPMHNLMLTSAIANGGMLMQPYLIERVENVNGELVKQFMPAQYGELMVANEAKGLQMLLEKVVTDGTGSALRTEEYTVAGKTGSAEFEKGKETHAWFVGYAPAESPRIAVCVIVEEGGSGGKTAA
ncbi:MAG: penicillin-binding protein 2, partial [Lachnospiraceae bacterium]|nr:penicillin-binding protein 2 [Lachnospiraceae bacterium]